jgi:hypothetical protein
LGTIAPLGSATVPRTTVAGAGPPAGPFPIPEIGIRFAFATGPAPGMLKAVKGFAINRIETQTKAEAKAREQSFKEDKGNS